MADVVVTCSRCGKLIEGEPALVVVQSGPRAPAQPVINLCPACPARCHGGSPERHHARQPEPAAQPTERPAGTSIAIAIAIRTTISSPAPAVAGEAKEVDPRAVAIAYVFLTFTILTFVLYQVWKLSLHVF